MNPAEIFLEKSLQPLEVQIYLVSPQVLEIHERLLLIYGDKEERSDLEKSISLKGKIIRPLVVSVRTGKPVVISGKCRLQIALKLGMDKIPIEVRHYNSADEELEDILVENLERHKKTNYQRIAEAAAWQEVFALEGKQKQRAAATQTNKKRLLQNSETALPSATHETLLQNSETALPSATHETLLQNSEQSSKKPHRINSLKQAAAKVGLSHTTYSNGKKVALAITQFRSEGREDYAMALEKILNESVDAAYQLCNHSQRDLVLSKIVSGEATSLKKAFEILSGGKFTHHIGAFVIPKVPLDDYLAKIGGRVASKLGHGRIKIWIRNMDNQRIETRELAIADLSVEAEPTPFIRQLIEILYKIPKLPQIHEILLDHVYATVKQTPEELEVLDMLTQRYFSKSLQVVLDELQAGVFVPQYDEIARKMEQAGSRYIMLF